MENQKQEQTLKNFANALILAKENRITKAKDTSIKPLNMVFDAVDFGFNALVIEKVSVTITREQINKIVCSLLGCGLEQYKKIVLSVVEKEVLFTEYNQSIRQLLKDNKTKVLESLKE